jgi:hypothetical protein
MGFYRNYTQKFIKTYSAGRIKATMFIRRCGKQQYLRRCNNGG